MTEGASSMDLGPDEPGSEQEGRLWTVKQTSRHLGISMYSVRILIDEGKIAADEIGGRIYISSESVTQYLASLGRKESA